MIIDKVLHFLTCFLGNGSRMLDFKFHEINNQILKYLNKNITHTKATIKATTSSALNSLVKPTSRIKVKYKLRVSEWWIDNAISITKSGLNLENFTSMG